jgi:hypothetical protein
MGRQTANHKKETQRYLKRKLTDITTKQNNNKRKKNRNNPPKSP